MPPLRSQPEGAPWRHPRANRQAALGDAVIAYEFQRARRRTVGLSVGLSGLSVRAPGWVPIGQIEAFVQHKADWILTKLKQVEDRLATAEPPILWQAGAKIPYLGQTLELAKAPTGLAAHHNPDTQKLHLEVPHTAGPDHWQRAAQAWLRQQALNWFTPRVEHYTQALGVSYRQLSLSSATARWGSASADRTLRLNWRLIHLPPELIDYVVAHEVSHLVEMNHSPRFWAVVARLMPDYAQRRAWLKRIPIPRD